MFVPRTAPDVAAVELDGEAVLYDEDRKTVHLLSPTATVLWNCLRWQTARSPRSQQTLLTHMVSPPRLLWTTIRVACDVGRHNLLVGVIADPEPQPELLDADELSDESG